MATLVCMGATLQCSFGLAPSTLVVLPGQAARTDRRGTIRIAERGD